jgi:hypothetical protein
MVKYLAMPDTGGGAKGATYVLWNLPFFFVNYFFLWNLPGTFLFSLLKKINSEN